MIYERYPLPKEEALIENALKNMNQALDKYFKYT